MLQFENTKLYTDTEVAVMLNMNPQTIGSLRRRGKIRFTKVGRNCYIPEDALKEYLQGELRTYPANG